MTGSEGRLVVTDLHVRYVTAGRTEHAVKGVTFEVAAGEVFGIVGESGSGKSSIAQAILRLEPESAVVSGQITYGDLDMAALGEAQLRKVRGTRIGMVFQDPSASLNPVFQISSQISDTIRRHRPGVSRREAVRLAGEAIEAMGIPAARLRSYPHQLSGGMRQRALIAAAMAPDPAFIVADEPTSDLDTVSQAQILQLLLRLRDSRNLGILLISHDMRVVSTVCDRIGVMNDGELVEVGPTAQVLHSPRHPYTQGLIRISQRERIDGGRFVTMADVRRELAAAAGEVTV